jgi:hypothetical protein
MLLLTKRGADDAKPIDALNAQTISILSTLHISHRERRELEFPTPTRA